MSDSIAHLHQKIDSARDLQSVVRTLKAIAASNISHYEQAVSALADYNRTVQLGLSVALRDRQKCPIPLENHKTHQPETTVVVFGSDQGLVGQFNEIIADFAFKNNALASSHLQIWTVGESVYQLLTSMGMTVSQPFAVPQSVKAIAPLVGQILLAYDHLPNFPGSAEDAHLESRALYLFYNHPTPEGLYSPVMQRLLPLDNQWLMALLQQTWPTSKIPQVISKDSTTLSALISEYVFVSLFRASAESLASENSSRLAAMERAEKNIKDMLENFQKDFHELRQNTIDEELFDVTAGFEGLLSANSSTLNTKKMT